jgi:serpin B
MKLPLLLFAFLLLSAVALSGQPPDSDQTALTAGNNALAVDLYGQLRNAPGNLFFSPASISTAFGMAYAGARGQTAAQMATVFHFTLPPAQLHPAMGALLGQMNAQHAGYELHAADALWAERDAHFLPGYLDLTRADYAAGFHRVDFKAAPDQVRATINQWIAQQTNNKIQNLIAPGVLTPATRLVLTNAIYFKGTWLDPFEKSLSQDEDFHVSAMQTVKAPMMHRTGTYRYFDGGTFQALELPYQGNDLSMVVFLPRDTAGLAALERSFTAADAKDWLQHLAAAPKVILSMPRFTMTQEFELSSALRAMGLPLAFSGAADFSGMTGKPDFTISAAIHKAYIDVNEQGTEAAAATSIVMRALAMRSQQPEPPPVVFRADHPFLFLIRQTQSGAILFMGRVDDPTK